MIKVNLCGYIWSFFLLFIFRFWLFFFLGLLFLLFVWLLDVELLETHLNCQLLKLLFCWFVVVCFRLGLRRWLRNWRLGLGLSRSGSLLSWTVCFLQTCSNCSCKFRILSLKISKSSSRTSTSTCCSSSNYGACYEAIADYLSWFNNKTMRIIFILYSTDKSLHFIDLFFRAISKADNINGNCIFL